MKANPSAATADTKWTLPPPAGILPLHITAECYLVMCALVAPVSIFHSDVLCCKGAPHMAARFAVKIITNNTEMARTLACSYHR